MEWKKGDTVYHKRLGVGTFVEHDLHAGECVVEFVDEDGYKDEHRVSTGLLTQVPEED